MAARLFHIGPARTRRAAIHVPDVISTPDTAGVASVGMVCECTATALGTPPHEVIVVRVAGEVDLFTGPVMQGALADSFARGPCDLLVDLAAMTFCDVRGLNTLVQAGATAAERGIGYAVTAAPAQVRRVWPMLWPVGDLPVQFPSAAAGVLAAMTRSGDQTDDDLARWAPKHGPGRVRHWPTPRPAGVAGSGLVITERQAGPLG